MPAWWWGTMTSKLGAILYCHIAYQQIERSIVVVVQHKHSIQNRHRNQAKGTTIFWCTEVTRHKLHSICLRVNPSESVTILLRCVDLNPPNTAWAWCHHSCETNHCVNQALRCQSIGLGIVFDEYNTCTYMQNGNLQKKIVFQSNTMHTAHCEFHSVTLTSIIHHSLCIVRWAHLMRLTPFLRAVDTHSFGGFSSTSLWTSASVLSSKALSVQCHMSGTSQLARCWSAVCDPLCWRMFSRQHWYARLIAPPVTWAAASNHVHTCSSTCMHQLVFEVDAADALNNSHGKGMLSYAVSVKQTKHIAMSLWKRHTSQKLSQTLIANCLITHNNYLIMSFGYIFCPFSRNTVTMASILVL